MGSVTLKRPGQVRKVHQPVAGDLHVGIDEGRFDRVCREHEIEHRFTKPNHPWTNGQSNG